MFKKKFLQLFILTIITGCSSAPKETISKIKFVPDIEENKFAGITKIDDYLEVNNYRNKFIVASPDHKRFAEFNNFFQLGILTAKNQLKITNEIKFVNQDNLNLSEANKNFLIGPLSGEIVSKIDGLFKKRFINQFYLIQGNIIYKKLVKLKLLILYTSYKK